MNRSREAWLKFLATRLVGVAVDAAVIGFAYLSAFALRFDFREPVWGWRNVASSFILVAAVYLAALLLTGCYRLPWRRICVAQVPRYFAATLAATVALTVMRWATPSMTMAHIRPPYSITVFTWCFATVGIIGVRGLWRTLWLGSRDDRRLLERQVRNFDNTVAARFFAGKTVLVTGAGGSIGSEISVQLAAAGVRRLILVERGEYELYAIHRKLQSLAPSVETLPALADCGDRETMDRLLAANRPEVVLHAAAYKHVPLVEANVEAGYRNNVTATKNLVETAAANGVRRFVLISTDKAVNPISAMGRQKREAERAVLGMNGKVPGCTCCAVRFGNVFGSSGSVVPLFREQIAHRGPVTITHPDMRRYFMTVGEAVSLVLQAASRTEGALYTLDMGESVKIVDLAESMIAQAGYRPYVDVPIVFTGIRPGEKLFEELDVSGKSHYQTDMAKIYITRADES